MITLNELGLIILFIANTMTGIFNSLDSVYLYSGISILDFFVAIMFLDLVTWFVMEVMSIRRGEKKGEKKNE